MRPSKCGGVDVVRMMVFRTHEWSPSRYLKNTRCTVAFAGVLMKSSHSQ